MLVLFAQHALNAKFQGMPEYILKYFNRDRHSPWKKNGLFLRVGDTTLDFEGQGIYLAAMKRDPNSYEVPMTDKALTFPYHILIYTEP